MITLTFGGCVCACEPLESARGQDAVKVLSVLLCFEQPERPSTYPRIARLATASLALSLVMVVVAFRLLRLGAKSTIPGTRGRISGFIAT